MDLVLVGCLSNSFNILCWECRACKNGKVKRYIPKVVYFEKSVRICLEDLSLKCWIVWYTCHQRSNKSPSRGSIDPVKWPMCFDYLKNISNSLDERIITQCGITSNHELDPWNQDRSRQPLREFMQVCDVMVLVFYVQILQLELCYIVTALGATSSKNTRTLISVLDFTIRVRYACWMEWFIVVFHILDYCLFRAIKVAVWRHVLCPGDSNSLANV